MLPFSVSIYTTYSNNYNSASGVTTIDSANNNAVVNLVICVTVRVIVTILVAILIMVCVVTMFRRKKKHLASYPVTSLYNQLL